MTMSGKDESVAVYASWDDSGDELEQELSREDTLFSEYMQTSRRIVAERSVLRETITSQFLKFNLLNWSEREGIKRMNQQNDERVAAATTAAKKVKKSRLALSTRRDQLRAASLANLASELDVPGNPTTTDAPGRDGSLPLSVRGALEQLHSVQLEWSRVAREVAHWTSITDALARKCIRGEFAPDDYIPVSSSAWVPRPLMVWELDARLKPTPLTTCEHLTPPSCPTSDSTTTLASRASVEVASDDPTHSNVSSDADTGSQSPASVQWFPMPAGTGRVSYGSTPPSSTASSASESVAAVGGVVRVSGGTPPPPPPLSTACPAFGKSISGEARNGSARGPAAAVGTAAIASPSGSGHSELTTSSIRERHKEATRSLHGITRQYDKATADRAYVMQVYDSRTLVEDLLQYLTHGTMLHKCASTHRPALATTSVLSSSSHHRTPSATVDAEVRTNVSSSSGANDASSQHQHHGQSRAATKERHGEATTGFSGPLFLQKPHERKFWIQIVRASNPCSVSSSRVLNAREHLGRLPAALESALEELPSAVADTRRDGAPDMDASHSLRGVTSWLEDRWKRMNEKKKKKKKKTEQKEVPSTIPSPRLGSRRSGGNHTEEGCSGDNGEEVWLYWVDPLEPTRPKSRLNLATVTGITLGPYTPVFRRYIAKPIRAHLCESPEPSTLQQWAQYEDVAHRCFSLHTKQRTVDLIAHTVNDFEAWVLVLCQLVGWSRPGWGRAMQWYGTQVQLLRGTNSHSSRYSLKRWVQGGGGGEHKEAGERSSAASHSSFNSTSTRARRGSALFSSLVGKVFSSSNLVGVAELESRRNPSPTAGARRREESSAKPAAAKAVVMRDPAAVGLSAATLQRLGEAHVAPSVYMALRERYVREAREVLDLLRLFQGNTERVYQAVGGIHPPQVNDEGALWVTKGELRYHTAEYVGRTFQVAESSDSNSSNNGPAAQAQEEKDAAKSATMKPTIKEDPPTWRGRTRPRCGRPVAAVPYDVIRACSLWEILASEQLIFDPYYFHPTSLTQSDQE